MRLVFGAVASLTVLAVTGALLVRTDALAQSPVPGTPALAALIPALTPPAGRGDAAPLQGTGVIRGRVVAADSGAPLLRVEVRLQGSPLTALHARTVSTDELGRYELSNLPPGRYTLTATKAGYLTWNYGQRRAFEAPRPIELAAAQKLDELDFRLPKASVIVAHVTDDLGDPIGGVRVRLERYVFAGGERRLAAVGLPATTTDRGTARLPEVPPGEYVVSATVLRGNPQLDANDSGRSYGAPTYYPGTAIVSEAHRVTVGSGQEVAIAFPLAAVRTVRIAGFLRRADGSVPSEFAISIAQRFAPNMAGGLTLENPIGPDGSFELVNLMPGQYELSARPSSKRTEPIVVGEYARMSVTLSGEDVTGLVMTTTQGMPVRGQLVFDTGARPSGIQPGAFPITFTGGVTQTRLAVNDDWTFEAFTVGNGILRADARVTSRGWFLKAVVLDGKDVTDTPTDFSPAKDFQDLKVVMTQKRTELTGGALDARNVAATDYAIVVFPEDRSQWTQQTRSIAAGRPDQQGRFRILGLPPGRYLAAAVDFLSTGEERDPELLARLQRVSTRLTLSEGESRAISLRMTSY